MNIISRAFKLSLLSGLIGLSALSVGRQRSWTGSWGSSTPLTSGQAVVKVPAGSVLLVRLSNG